MTALWLLDHKPALRSSRLWADKKGCILVNHSEEKGEREIRWWAICLRQNQYKDQWSSKLNRREILRLTFMGALDWRWMKTSSHPQIRMSARQEVFRLAFQYYNLYLINKTLSLQFTSHQNKREGKRVHANVWGITYSCIKQGQFATYNGPMFEQFNISVLCAEPQGCNDEDTDPALKKLAAVETKVYLEVGLKFIMPSP